MIIVNNFVSKLFREKYLTFLVFIYFLSYYFFIEIEIRDDAIEYVNLSKNFKDYLFNGGGGDRGLRMFLYPFTLSLFQFIALDLSIILINAVLISFSFYFLNNLFDDRTGKILLLLLFLFSPNIIFYNTKALAEVYCFFAVSFTVYNSQKYQFQNLLLNLINIFLLFYIRPSLVPFIAIIFLSLLIKKDYMKLAILFVLMIVIILPWFFRQQVLEFGFPTNHVNYSNADSMASRDIMNNLINEENLNIFEILLDGENISKEFSNLEAFYYEYPEKFIPGNDFMIYLYIYVYGFLQILFGWSGYYISQIFGISIALSNFLGLCYLSFLYFMNIAYLVFSKINKTEWFIYSFTIFIYLILHASSFYASTRFRVPFEPVLYYFTVSGFMVLKQRINRL